MAAWVVVREVFASQLARGVSVGRLGCRRMCLTWRGGASVAGTPLPRPVFGRCWRCALAWRLAVGRDSADGRGSLRPQRVVA